MNEAFEMLPFAGQSGAAGEQEWQGEWSQEWQGEDEAEWEGERPRPGGGRGGMRGGGLRARPPLRGQRRPAPPRYQAPGRRPPRYAAQPLPYLPPRYRGWGGYPAIYPTLYPAPYPVAEPAFGDRQEPDADQDQGQGQDLGADQGPDDEQMQAEVPPTLAGTIGRVPEAAALRYLALGTLANALRDPNGRGAGLYVIEFDAGGRRRAYSGQTDDLHRRLLQHRLCGQMMGVDLSGHQVYVAPLSSAAQRRRIEQRIHDDMFANQRGVLTNQRRELELAVLGEMWS
ncbi:MULTISPECIES: DUF1373 domain-containing protein [unclassified Janthinobacterium]|uniref:DUF1373 domain-containing protein n=1 Tax=unclassified Janthinobacterium TaxID=2610881 RepID=UPI001E5CF5B6|nr:MULTISPECIES: DUF1373 domain-containing protein [unclassified Janthinobacterium]MCC7644478.1 hypothetical protein [Janthinobacterium sp. EB271-G4-3-1]MCC7693990.1 hypothetical protein [Janthinobacterium sp. EB271-G4-3-2]